MTNSGQTATTLAAGAGGVLWAMANAFAIIFALSPAHRRNLVLACARRHAPPPRR